MAAREVNQKKPKPIRLPNGFKNMDYDDWLEHLRTHWLATELIERRYEFEEKLPPDGYAALMRWLDIFENPSKMEKLHKSKLATKSRADIMDVAIGDDDALFYEQLIRENVEQLNSSSTSPQEVARITTNINIFRKELKEIRSRKPKEGTVLAQVLKAASDPVISAVSTPVKKRAKLSKAVRGVATKKTGNKSSKSRKKTIKNAKEDSK